MKLPIFILLHAFFLCSVCPASASESVMGDFLAAQNAENNITFSILGNRPYQYGYDILINNQKVIHQPHIPAIAGQRGFRTKKEATQIARLMIQKIQKGQMPPTVTIEELKQYKIIK